MDGITVQFVSDKDVMHLIAVYNEKSELGPGHNKENEEHLARDSKGNDYSLMEGSQPSSSIEDYTNYVIEEVEEYSGKVDAFEDSEDDRIHEVGDAQEANDNGATPQTVNIGSPNDIVENPLHIEAEVDSATTQPSEFSDELQLTSATALPPLTTTVTTASAAPLSNLLPGNLAEMKDQMGDGTIQFIVDANALELLKSANSLPNGLSDSLSTGLSQILQDSQSRTENIAVQFVVDANALIKAIDKMSNGLSQDMLGKQDFMSEISMANQDSDKCIDTSNTEVPGDGEDTLEGVNECTRCGKSFMKHDHLVQHREVCDILRGIELDEEPIHRCNICGRIFKNRGNLVQHELTHSKPQSFQCHICFRTLTRKYDFQKHIQRHEEKGEKKVTIVKNVQCPVCLKELNTPTALKIHLRRYTGERPFVCPQCEKGFNQKSHLQIHQKVCNGQLDELSKKFSAVSKEKYPSDLDNIESKKQMSIMLSTLVEEVALTICFEDDPSLSSTNVPTTPETSLDRYISRTAQALLRDINPFPCEKCDKRFKHQCTLNVHMKSHTKELPHPCTDCDKVFKHLDSLKFHLKTVHSKDTYVKHNMLKTHTCPICKEEFPKKIMLINHSIVHNGPGQFQCELCEKKFDYLRSLRQHMKSHSNVRKFHCKLCNVSYKRRDHLRSHIIRNHPDLKGDVGGTVHTCSICKKSYPTKGMLDFTFFKVHIVDMVEYKTGIKKHQCKIYNLFP